MILDANAKKPIIEYPCSWSYRLIGRVHELIENEVKTALGDKKYDLKLTNKSKTGKFVSIELSVEVHHEEERLKYFDYFSKSQVIMQVL